MNCNKNDLLLYAVTDRHWLEGDTLYNHVKMSLEGGVTFLQLREKNLDEDSFLEEARQLKILCKEYNVPFVINDNVDVALAIDADGVHVGQSDMEALDVRAKLGPNKIIGVSAHTVEEAILAKEHGADYLGVGAVFTTGSKDDAQDVSFETLKAICEAVDIPVVAIGGITYDNVSKLAGSGICGIAVISAIYGQKNITSATKALYNKTSCVINNSNDIDNINIQPNCFFAPTKTLPTALSIAGSDSSGGAGIQADIKSMMANGVYAMTAITALTAQNTMGVSGIMEVTPDFLAKQIDAVFTDIRPDAVKIGMVSSSSLIETIACKLKEYNAKNIVVDPVMVATSGAALIETKAIDALKRYLFPIADLLTPNIPEAKLLSGMDINNENDMCAAAKLIGDTYNCAVLIKGGHQISTANDYLYTCNEATWFYGNRIDNPNTHGTGCTLSSSIAANLAKGFDMKQAVRNSKDYISGALNAMLNLGNGSGPINHGYKII